MLLSRILNCKPKLVSYIGRKASFKRHSWPHNLVLVYILKRKVSLNVKEDIANIVVLRFLCIFLEFKTLFQKDSPTDRF